ncbi:unnamed protein product [Cyprideis torosa]|uniref:Uncharacterized protein n=1 Tax=Cyprideis torosa TaxID=163714 RepID=A0A7R8ZX18_9CRUS|nr:unnamed protein product [Cyprideis torosa]CAG0906371.1 unnamed protein product [Cyprideis torosa]
MYMADPLANACFGVRSAGVAPIPAKKRGAHGTWFQTDLDTLSTEDAGILKQASPASKMAAPDGGDPYYMNATAYPSHVPHHQQQYVELSDADDRMKRFYGIQQSKEKSLEIKTVRSVKRESNARSKSVGPPVPSSRNGQWDPQTGQIFSPGGMDPPSLDSGVEEESSGTDFPSYQTMQYQHPMGIRLDDEEDPQRVIETDPVLSQFQRSHSLPRNYGRRFNWKELPSNPVVGGSGPPPPVPPPPPGQRKADSSYQSVSMGDLGHPTVVRAEFHHYHHHIGALETPNTARSSSSSLAGDDRLSSSTSSLLKESKDRFKSDTAREIIAEMEQQRKTKPTNPGHKRRMKRKHLTISSSKPSQEGSWRKRTVDPRARDDMDIEHALRSRLTTPDVVKSTMAAKNKMKINENTIDSILGAPKKISIPERYVPDDDDEVSATEQLQRSRKAEAIKKMLLSEPSIEMTPGETAEIRRASFGEGGVDGGTAVGDALKAKVETERKHREQLLALSQVIAKEASQRTKRVAAVRSANSTPASFDYGTHQQPPGGSEEDTVTGDEFLTSEDDLL